MQPESPGTTTSSAPWANFPPITPRQWRECIRADLKGADLEKLIWHTLDGLAIQPFYTKSDVIHAIPLSKRQPGNDWLVRQDVTVASISEAQSQIREALQGGATSLGLHLGTPLSTEDLTALLEDLPLGEIALHLSGSAAPSRLLNVLLQVAEDRGVARTQLRGSIASDPLSRHSQDEKIDVAEAMNEQAALLTRLKDALNLHAISVDARPYHNAGASIAQELGCTLAAASEYLAQMTARSQTVADTVMRMRFEVPVGTSFFPEVAKLRALRMLFAQLVRAFDKELAAPSAFVRADTSRWSLTLYDPRVNLLRTTTEATAAILGGCDELSIHPYDAAMTQPGTHARRLALNIQHILKHEAHLDVVADPAAGSYYLETLTNELAAAGWAFFQQIETRGGLLVALQDGFVQQQIKTSRVQRLTQIDTGQTAFVGTNTFPDVEETRLEDAPQDRETLSSEIEALPDVRGTAHFEALRLRTERHAQETGYIPCVLPLLFGDPVMANARATFARNFFGVAGFQILPEEPHETPEQTAKAVMASQAAIVVLCSDDASYADKVPPICKQLTASEASPLVVVAGHPADAVDSLKKAGVDAFIHRKTPMLDALTDFQNRLALSE